MFKYSYILLSNSVEFSVILQCTMTQYHICRMFSRPSYEYRPWEPETGKDLLPHQVPAPQVFCSPLRYCIWPWQTRPHQERTQQCKIIVRPLEPSSSLLCVMQSVVSPQPLSHLFVAHLWDSDLCMHKKSSFHQHLPIQPYMKLLVRSYNPLFSVECM